MSDALNLNKVRTTTQFFSFLHSYPQVFEIFSENFSGGRKMEGETVRRAVNRGLAGKIACQEPYTL